VDFTTFAFFATIIYLFPAFLGYTMDPYNKLDLDGIPIPDDAYLIYFLVFFFITITAVITDRTLIYQTKKTVLLFENKYFPIVCLAFSYLGFFMSIFSNGSIYFAELDKVDILESLDAKKDRWLILMQHASTLVLGISILSKRKLLILLVIPIFLFDFVIVGHRSTLAFCILTLLMIKIADIHKIRILSILFSIRGFAFFLLIVTIGIFFIGIKDIIPFIKNGNVAEIFEHIAGNAGEWLEYAFVFSEPSVIQATLSAVIEKNIKNDIINPLDIVISFVPFSVDMGISRMGTYLNQEQTYPGLRWGTASNIWAYMYSSGGYTSIILFLIIYSYILFVGNKMFLLIRSNCQFILGWSMILFVFYFHRNDLFFQIDMQKRVIAFSIIFYFFSEILVIFSKIKFLK
jgi:hypothetical protein